MEMQSELKNEIIYLSGPMSGLPDFNYPAFAEVAELIRSWGCQVLSPHEIDEWLSPAEKWEVQHTHVDRRWSFYMRHAIRMQLRCTMWVGLPGWTQSRGARREFDIALDLNQSTFFVNNGLNDITGTDELFLIRVH